MTDLHREFLDAAASEGLVIIDPESLRENEDRVLRLHMEGDKRGESSVTYKLTVNPDGSAFGWMTAWRMGGDVFKWSSKPVRGKTKEQRDAARVWHEQQREMARAEAERSRTEGLRRIRADWEAAWPVKSHAYLDAKGLKACEGLRGRDGELLVPAYQNGELMGYQRIWEGGAKKFAQGSCTKDVSFDILGNKSTVAVCEGLATGLRINMLLGWTVRIGFSAGQMVAAALSARADYPGSRILVCGDNDQWTFAGGKTPLGIDGRQISGDDPRWSEWREEGRCSNAGKDASLQAAARISAQACLPPIPSDHAGKATDWDDYAREWGDDAARAALGGVPVIEAQWEPEYDDYESDMIEAVNDLPIEKLVNEIRPQGYIGKKYYFFPRSTGDIEEFLYTELSSDTAYYHLARESFWLSFFDDPEKASGKDVVRQFKPKLMEMCKDKGKFDPERVLSTGVWPDGKGGVVANMGNMLYIPGVGFMDHSDYESEKVYISAAKSIDIKVEPLKNADAVKLRYICEGLSWRHRISGSLLAGWIYASILSGALRWRPHIFVTGGKGSGKTTVMKGIIKMILQGWSRNSDGGTTGAGFRRKLGNQARPVVSDEMETETKKQRDTADDVLTLARQSSSGAEYANAYVDITVHSCFCFGGINPNIKHGADKDRITELELIKDRSEGFRERWKVKEREIKDTLSGDYGRRLARRAIDNADAFLANLEVFEDELSVMLGDSRSAEQFAPMIAGLYGLHSTGRITPERAKEWVRDQDWDFFYQEEEGSDAEKMVSHLLTAMAEFTVSDKTNRVTVSDLIRLVITGGLGSESAKMSLGRYGLKVDGGWLVVANSKSRIGELMRDTSWTVPKNTLSRYPGAESVGTTRFAPGVVSRGIRIPMAGLIDGVVEELPIDGDNGGDWG